MARRDVSNGCLGPTTDPGLIRPWVRSARHRACWSASHQSTAARSTVVVAVHLLGVMTVQARSASFAATAHTASVCVVLQDSGDIGIGPR